MVVALCGNASAWWNTSPDAATEVAAVEIKTEIEVGQIWKWTCTGEEWEVLEVGEKFVVYTYAYGTWKTPDVKTKEDFLEDCELVAGITTVLSFNIASSDDVLVSNDEPIEGQLRETTCDKCEVCYEIYNGTKWVSLHSKKPYIHKNPNNGHWICSEHGDLDKDKDSFVVSFELTRATIYGTTYCHECYWDTQIKLVNQHITGVKE